MESKMDINPGDIAQAQEEFNAQRANIIAKNATCSVGIRKAARVPEAVAKNTKEFDIDLKQGKICDQQRSGRCWMFASLNTYRYRIMKKYNLKTFELSQAYPLFFDKLEKSNWFFENILDTLDEPRDSRLIAFLLTDPICDGGQWDMFRALTNKYGVCPKEAMPETACSSNTHELDAYLTRYLRGCAMSLREAHEAHKTIDELEQMKNSMLKNVYKMLVICLGEPPCKFDVRYHDKDDELALEGTFTPQEFFQTCCDMCVDDYVSVISAPTQDKPFNKTYTVSRLGNIVSEGQVKYLNLPIEELKKLAVAQLKDGLPVWFGCDVAQSYIGAEGIMDTASLDVDQLFGFKVEGCMNRAQRLDWSESVMTHAMVFEGVNFDKDGKTTLWKVENSWGKDHGKDGFDSISDAWFDEYVYQIVIDKKYLSQEQRQILDTQKPIELAPWDPMGTLAR